SNRFTSVGVMVYSFFYKCPELDTYRSYTLFLIFFRRIAASFNHSVQRIRAKRVSLTPMISCFNLRGGNQHGQFP
ncbi:MAG: hypothetical protein WA081_11490, partial [Desulfosalsimonadaceae bacterium]